MKLKRYRYQNPEPGDTGAGPAIPAPAEAPSAPLANHPEPATIHAPQSAEKPAQPAQADAGQPSTLDNEAKINALLDNIGKDVGATPETKPAAGETKAPTDGTKSPNGVPGSVPAATDPAKPATPADPKALDLTPPEGITERSKTRWTALADQAKLVPELERRVTETEAQLNGVRDLVAQSGLDQTEFVNMLDMGRLFKSADPKELQAALQQLDGLRADLATRLGVDAPGIDVLDQHPDLKAKVDGMTLSREDALEIVRLRGKGAQADQTQASQQQMEQFKRACQNAATEMDATLAQRAATPGHQAKVDHIRQYFADAAKLQGFVTTYQPNQWKAAILMMYDAYTPPAPAPVIPTTPQPLRPGHVASGVRVPNGKPISSTDAVANAWDAIGL